MGWGGGFNPGNAARTGGMILSGGTVDPSKGFGGTKSVNPFGAEGGSAGQWDVLGNTLDKYNPFVQKGKENKDLQQQQQASQQQQQKETGDVLSQMQQEGAGYYNKMSNAYGDYGKQMNALADKYAGDMEGQAKDAKQTYSNTILPKLQGLMEQAQQNAKGAMTLQQMQDPNNAVQQSYRNMFNQEAQGISRQGLADTGVLQAMGSQATAGQFAGMGGLMTGGQLQALQGANQGQAGAAMAAAQQRANDLRQQGIMTGIQQSNFAYGAGQEAQQAAAQSVGNYAGAYNQGRQIQDQYTGDVFGTRMGQNQANLGMSSGLAGLQYGLDTQAQNRQLGQINDKYGTQQGNLAAQIQQNNAMTQALMGAGGTVLGGMFGGAAGAAAGNKAGNAMGQANASTPYPQSGYNAYGYQGGSQASPYVSQNPYQTQVT